MNFKVWLKQVVDEEESRSEGRSYTFWGVEHITNELRVTRYVRTMMLTTVRPLPTVTQKEHEDIVLGWSSVFGTGLWHDDSS